MNKMNEKFIVIDTETTNSIDDPIVYDIGFAVVDRTGKVYEAHSYAIADVILDNEMMSSAYYNEKLPQYWEEIKNGKRLLRRFKTVKMILADVCKQYDIKVVVAHNARFDYRSLNLTQRYITSSKYRYFFPYGIKIWDTLKMSRKILKENEDYAQFCKDNGYITKNKQKRFTAEILYRFITGDNEFIEKHKGLDDVLIEKDIFAYCLNENPEINGALWDD
jgi:DNA polymerase III epsilon subunit-like protein